MKQAGLIQRLNGNDIFRVEVCSTQTLIHIILPFQRSTEHLCYSTPGVVQRRQHKV